MVKILRLDKGTNPILSAYKKQVNQIIEEILRKHKSGKKQTKF